MSGVGSKLVDYDGREWCKFEEEAFGLSALPKCRLEGGKYSQVNVGDGFLGSEPTLSDEATLVPEIEGRIFGL